MIVAVIAIPLVALAIMAWLAFTAPLGWQDDSGFHLGEPEGE